MSPARMAKIESAIRVALEFTEAFNRHDVAGMMKLTGEDCVFERSSPAPDGANYSGKVGIARFLQGLFDATPNARIEIEEVFGLGNRCVMRWKYYWTDAAGQSKYARGVDIFKVEGGLINERLSYVKG